jgi:hypothetical protein
VDIRPMTLEALQHLRPPACSWQGESLRFRRSDPRRVQHLNEVRDSYSYVLKFPGSGFRYCAVLVVRDTEQYYRIVRVESERDVPDPAHVLGSYVRTWKRARLEIERLVRDGGRV